MITEAVVYLSERENRVLATTTTQYKVSFFFTRVSAILISQVFLFSISPLVKIKYKLKIN
jgi:hypothetical protein